MKKSAKICPVNSMVGGLLRITFGLLTSYELCLEAHLARVPCSRLLHVDSLRPDSCLQRHGSAGDWKRFWRDIGRLCSPSGPELGVKAPRCPDPAPISLPLVESRRLAHSVPLQHLGKEPRQQVPCCSCAFHQELPGSPRELRSDRGLLHHCLAEA